MERKKIQRLDYIDIAKSLGMILIIWGHINYGWSHAFVYAFHIPLFFVLSGMVFDIKHYPDLKQFINKKIKSLIIPYIIFSFLTWIVWVAYTYVTHTQVENIIMPLFQTFIAQGSEGYLIHNVPLWFIMCLFTIELIYFFIAKLKRIIITIITLLLAIIGYSLINYCNIIDFSSVPWSIDAAFLGIPFFGFGHWLVCKYGHQGLMDIINRNKTNTITTISFLLICTYFLSQYNGSISFGHTNMGKNVFVAYIGAFIGVIMFIMLCMIIAGSSFNKTKIMQFIKWFGQNSFYAMVIHNPIKGVIIVITSNILQCDKSYVSRNFYYSLIAFIITLILTIIGIIIINWIKNKLIKNNN